MRSALLLILITFATPALAECKIGGCSGQLCIDASDENSATTCEWRHEYGCYKTHSECGEREDGSCGWKPTPELENCLKQPAPTPEEQQKTDTENHERFLLENRGKSCVTAGSYGQICLDAIEKIGKNNPDFDPTPNLAFDDRFPCYPQHAECALTNTRECQWQDKTGAFEACLANPSAHVDPAFDYDALDAGQPQ